MYVGAVQENDIRRTWIPGVACHSEHCSDFAHQSAGVPSFRRSGEIEVVRGVLKESVPLPLSKDLLVA